MKPKPIEEIAIKNLEFKANKPLFRLNIRLVSSSNDEITADQILSALESPFINLQILALMNFIIFDQKEIS
jgi:hypothetical protein